jgi:hypothetical protein
MKRSDQFGGWVEFQINECSGVPGCFGKCCGEIKDSRGKNSPSEKLLSLLLL